MKTREELVNEVCDNLAVKRPAAGSAVYAGLGMGLSVIGAVAVMAAWGFRADLGDIVAGPHFIGVAVALVALSFTGLYGAFEASKPGRVTGWLWRVGPWVSLVAIGAAFAAYLSTDTANAWAVGSDVSGMSCARAVILLAAIPLVCFFLLAKRLAPMNPAKVGALLGLAAAASGCLGLATHCASDNGFHLLIYHFGSVVALGVLAGAAAARLLRW